jgi:hypothetical protein
LQRARWIRTVSAAAGAPGLTVSVVERVLPNHVAVTVTDLCTVTELVATANVLLDAPLLTTTSEGTDATAGSLLLSWTPAPSFMGPVNVTVPVTPPPPVVLVGLTETDDRVGPAGGAGLTERLAVRGVFPTHAVICTMIGAAAGLEVMVKVVSSWPAGTTTLCGTCAASGWSLNSSTVVGAGSGKANETVPVADAPLFTWLGAMVKKLMMPSAWEGAGTARTIARAAMVARTARRRIDASFTGRT